MTTKTDSKYDTQDYLKKVDTYWRAANYLSVGQLFLRDNPLLKGEITSDDIKLRPIGHWGTIAPQNFIYAHLNRAILKYDLNMFYIEGSGHGGQVMVSNSYLDGSYSEIYPNISQDEKGMQRLFKQFSFPGGVASHAAPETPGSIHEGGELGYSISHGVGAILDNPDVIAAVEVGDGESETGPLAASLFSNKFINPIHDGAVLPIIQINGFKISNPTILSRMSDEDLEKYYSGLGWDPIFVETDGTDHMAAHEEMAKAMDQAIEKIKAIQKNARDNNDESLPSWPMIILRAPKGWTGPKKNLDGKPIENSFRAHQVPIPVDGEHMEHIDMLLDWMKSYHSEDAFNADGTPKEVIAEVTPKGDQRMAKNPITNGGLDPKPLKLEDIRKFAVPASDLKRNDVQLMDTEVLSKFVADTMVENPTNFRIFGPDETASNRLYEPFKVTSRQWMEDIHEPNDEWMAHSGRVIDSQLSEHQDEGWLEGYVLTGRHGFFASYEAFTRVVDSMLTQHYKWLRKAQEQPWRHDYPSLNIINSSDAFQQDHNGYTHQDPGMLGHLAEKGHELVNEYIPTDANSLLAVMNKSLQSREVINLIVASKHPRTQWFTIEEATELVNNGLGIVPWASNDDGVEPDIIFATAGTEATMESLAAITLLLKAFPDLKVRFINIVDILKLRKKGDDQDDRGLTDEEFDRYFTTDKPVIMAFHGFENTYRGLVYDRHNHNIHFHGYRENGDITTPFDMRVLNELDRFHLAKDAINMTQYAEKAGDFSQHMDDMVAKHNQYIRDNGVDLPEVENWQWKDLQ
ncbi:phosphoketolase [Lactobacillus selangorensis]|uniref:Phosphoketolase n=1 Tax=Lactobacillus selangorensis TaxID=81857 RepID=A0A0R2FZV7_9LACO|nr:phosphoketolase family protein [Lactobacillus selangorensis]KRN28571.1 phosphoketolase [Lactobacillus selangorensis]KRN33019.1 phosphoketolase [Lactobacillus selangorensis]